jgi:hypothetical protein
MTQAVIERPLPDEYASYYGRYISKITEDNVLDLLERAGADTVKLIRSIPESKGDHRYAPDKWSIKDVLGHVIDTERIFCYRALRFARSDPTPLPGFEQDDFVKNGAHGQRSLADMATEFAAVRAATVAMFRSFTPEALVFRGRANDIELTPRAVAYIIAGHERHHVDILRQRYL